MTRPTLRTARLELRPMTLEHLDGLAVLDSDPEVMRFITGRARTREQVEKSVRRRTGPAFDAVGLGDWSAFLGEDLIGWLALTLPTREDQGPVEGQAELGYRFLQRFWGQGYASEAARELVRHGFVDVGLDRIFAEAMAVNAGSRAVMASAGLSHVRTFHPHFDDPLPGTEQGEVEYAVTRAEWEQRQAGGV